MDRNTASTETPQEAREHLWKLIRATRFAMVTSSTPDGALHSRPLTTQNGRDDTGDTLVYFIGADSAVATEVERNAAVGVAYANTDDDSYVSISGRARVVRDAERARRLWTVPAQSWFPEGPGDDKLRLLEVTMEAAEYWDVKSSKLVQMARMVTAAATGKPPTDMGQHRNVPVG